jgi:hypothetical protein
MGGSTDKRQAEGGSKDWILFVHFLFLPALLLPSFFIFSIKLIVPF